jgi:hypothetical protein
MGGGGKKKKPKVDNVAMPAPATPAPPPEETAKKALVEDGASRARDKEAKRRGTSALKIDLNVNPAGTATPGGGGGLSIPRG